MSDVQEHEQTQRIEEYVVFPQHEQRTESELFRHNKRLLVHDLNLPCYKCNVKHGNNPPPEAFLHREVHHFLVEWSAWHAVDPMKVQRVLDGGLFDPYGYASQMKGQSFESPDDIRNLLVLCENHHRDGSVGIHHSSTPEWMSDMVARDGVDILLTKDEWNLLASHQAVLDDMGKLAKESDSHDTYI